MANQNAKHNRTKLTSIVCIKSLRPDIRINETIIKISKTQEENQRERKSQSQLQG